MKGILSVSVISVLLIMSLSTVQSKRRKRKDPVDFTVVDDSTLQNVKTSQDGLPVDVNVNFDVLNNIVSLNLKRNPKVATAKDSVYVIRKSEAGVPVLVSQIVEDTEVFGEYQDPINNAIFTLSCPKNTSTTNTTGPCDTTMEGTFRVGTEEYRMSVMENNALNRVRRAANPDKKDKLWRKAKKLARQQKKASKVYGIFKTEPTQATPTDFKEAEPLIRGRVNAAFGHDTKVVRENAMPGDRMYNVEVLAVVDYGLYERFFKASNQPHEAAKDNEAKYNLKKYFSHVFNGVDMLYKSIDEPDFSVSVAVSQFVIADSPEASIWTTPHIDRVTDGRHELLVSIPLDEVLRWSLSANNIPENDHIMLFTDYDLYSTDGGTKDIRTAGYARVSSVCSLDSVSVVEDHGGFQSINAAAHELGHSLGSRHDGRLNSCNPSDQFIMTAHGGFETEQNRLNPWRFSQCSIDYFKRYVNSLPPNNCLTDPVDMFDRHEFLHYVSQYPGQDYTPNQQCQDILGLDSYYGWGPELGMFSTICTEMSCKVPGSGRSYRIYKAATGTSCGDKMWCREGQCVFDQQAPTKDPQCVFGDTQRRFGGNKSCREYMLENPMRCYDSFYRTRCCETCDRLNTGVQSCEYGDKFLNCRQSGCWDRSYARDCCSTCGLAPHPVIRPLDPVTPVTPPPTRPPTHAPAPRPTDTNDSTPINVGDTTATENTTNSVNDEQKSNTGTTPDTSTRATSTERVTTSAPTTTSNATVSDNNATQTGSVFDTGNDGTHSVTEANNGTEGTRTESGTTPDNAQSGNGVDKSTEATPTDSGIDKSIGDIQTEVGTNIGSEGSQTDQSTSAVSSSTKTPIGTSPSSGGASQNTITTIATTDGTRTGSGFTTGSSVKQTSWQPKVTLTTRQPETTLTTRQPRKTLPTRQPETTLITKQPKGTLTTGEPEVTSKTSGASTDTSTLQPDSTAVTGINNNQHDGDHTDNTWPPVRTTTTPRSNLVPVTTARPTSGSGSGNGANGGSGLTPSGSSGLCIRQNANFLIYLSCSKLPNIFGGNACDNSLAARFCCEKCPAPGETSCEDSPDCSVQYARECYIPRLKAKCCRTCKRFETNQPGCEYGDKIRNCNRYTGQLGLSFVCNQYGTYCCGVCNAFAGMTNSEPQTTRAGRARSMSLPDIAIDTSGTSEAGTPNGADFGGLISAGGQRMKKLQSPSSGRLGLENGSGNGNGRGRGNNNNGRGGRNNRRGGGRGRGRGNNRNSAINVLDSPSDNPSEPPNATSAQDRTRGSFIPVRTVVFRGPPREPRGRAIRRSPRINFFISQGKK